MYYFIGKYNLNNVSLYVKVIFNDIIIVNISIFVICVKFKVKNKGEVNYFWNEFRWFLIEIIILFRLRNSRYLKSFKINLFC